MTAELLAHNVVAHWLQAGLVTGVAGLGIAVLRLRRPGFLLRYWQAVLLLLLVAPWIQPWQPVAAAPAADLTPISGMEQAFDGGDGVSVAGRVIALPAARWRVAPWTWVLGLLAAGVIVRLGWIGLGLLRLARLARAADRIAPPAVARELLARFRVSAAFVQHPEVRMPCSFGLFRPTVMMPAAFDRLEPAFQRAIICHELLHIKRRDFARVVVEDVAAALLWFHPWVWLLRRRIRLHREQVVDAAVVHCTRDRRAYVRCLVELAGHPLPLRLASPMLRSTELRTRTDALFEKEGTMSTRRLAVAATGLCVALGATVWTACATVPLGGTAPGGAQQTTSAGQPAQELEQQRREQVAEQRAVTAALRRLVEEQEGAITEEQEAAQQAVTAALRRLVEEQQGAITEEQQGAITQERIAVMVERLKQAVASISDQLEGGDTTAAASRLQVAALNMRVAALQEMVRRLQTELQEVGVPER